VSGDEALLAALRERVCEESNRSLTAPLLELANPRAVVADRRFERLDPAAEHLFQLGELFSRRTRVALSGRELVEEIFVKHASVAAQFIESAVRAGTELCQPRLQLTELRLDPVEPLVDFHELLVDAVEPLVDSRERLIDSVEPFFGHASLRPRDDDDTSSRDGLEEQSVYLRERDRKLRVDGKRSQKVRLLVEEVAVARAARDGIDVLR
jgi:hypothetical protein